MIVLGNPDPRKMDSLGRAGSNLTTTRRCCGAARAAAISRYTSAKLRVMGAAPGFWYRAASSASGSAMPACPLTRLLMCDSISSTFELKLETSM